jgi:hypothetical protein
MSDPLSDVSFPRRPAGVPYAEGDDHDALSLLESNGLGTSTSELIELLDAGLDFFKAAAARTLGARAEHDATPALERAARDADALETTRVQAAYALARLGSASGAELLASELEGNPEASPGPLQAAGALATLGDARGFEVVRAALESPNRVTAMIAAKQLHTFAGSNVDLREAFARALARPEPNIVGETRAQLEQLDVPWSGEL